MKAFLSLMIFLITLSSPTFGDFTSAKIEKFKWDELEVVYLEDSRFPMYTMMVYFADGALSDDSVKGLTQASMDYLTLGTRRFSQKDIAINLEFFGAGHAPNVTHEYSTYMVSGLTKDISPTIKKICHLFQDATYPVKELSREKKRILDSLENMASNPGALASRVFREESLSGTPYSYPVDGKIRDIKKWNQKLLKEKLGYLNNTVKKRIYLAGPRDVLKIKNVINNECGWRGQGRFERTVTYKKPGKSEKPKITLVPVPKSNQAQVRIGKFLAQDEIAQPELMSLASSYLGGGFTSRLMRVLRVQNGLTYGVGAFAGGQKQYGRSGISTSTAIQNITKLLVKTKETLELANAGEITPTDLERAKGSLAGSYPFGFESSASYIGQLLYLDHVGRPYSDLFKFPEIVMSFNASQVAKESKTLYNWEDLHIVVIGPKSLLAELKAFGAVEVRRFKDYL